MPETTDILDTIGKTSRMHGINWRALKTACEQGRVPAAVPFNNTYRIRRSEFPRTGIMPARKPQPRPRLKAIWRAA